MEKKIQEKDQNQNSEMKAHAYVLGLKHIGKLDFLKEGEIAARKKWFVVNNVIHSEAFAGGCYTALLRAMNPLYLTILCGTRIPILSSYWRKK